MIDRTTSIKRTVRLRVDGFDGDKVIFNGGDRVENLEGKIARTPKPLLSQLDTLDSVGGWVSVSLAGNGAQNFGTVVVTPETNLTRLEGRLVGNSKLTTPAGDFDVQEFAFSGYQKSQYQPGHRSPVSSQRYKARAWFAPRLNRIIKFSAETQGGSSMRVNEEVILESYSQ